MLHSIPLGILSFSSGGFPVDNSAMFDFASAEYLTRTPTTAGNRRTWTWSGWVKRSGLGNPGGPNTSHELFGVGAGSRLRFTSGDNLRLESPSGNHTFITTQVFRDPHAWYHIVLAFDSTQATDTNRRKLYVNGSQVTDFSSTTFTELGQNDEWNINSTSEHQIAKSNLADYFGGYLAEVVLVDGSALGPTSFGETDSNGVWRPIDVTGLTFGTNGFYMPFTTSTFLGADYTESGTQTTFNAASDWTGSTGSYTFTQGSIEADTGDKAVKSDQTFAGDFQFQWRYVAKANWAIGVYDTAEDGTFNDSNSSGGMGSMTDSFYIEASSVSANNDIKYGSSTVVNATTIANGDTWKIGRVGSQIKVYRNGAVVHTYSQTNSDTMRIVFAQGDTAADADSISWVDGAGSVGNNHFAVNAPTQTSDSPTKNYAVLSPLNLQANIALSEGNLKQVSSSNSQGMSFSSFPVTTGQKVYIEATISGASGGMTGCVKSTSAVPQNPSSDFDALASGDARLLNVANGDVFSADGVTVASNYAPNDSVPVTHMIALDLVNDKIYWGDAGVGASGWSNGSGSFNQAFGSAVGVDLDANLDWFFAMRGYNATIEVNFGATAFTVSPPTGYSSGYSAAIENKNRDTALTIEDGSAHFQTMPTWTGNNGSATYTQDGNSTFTPDLAIIKSRSFGSGGNAYDAVRGSNKGQAIFDSGVEDTEPDGVTFGSGTLSFTGGGSSGDINYTGRTYTAWTWLAGNGTVSNSNGSITSTVSVNQTAGFSIVQWSGNRTNATIGHGLGSVPSLIITKALNASNSWRVYHAANTSAPETEFLEQNASTVTQDEATIWNDTAPTSTVFSVGTDGGSNENAGGTHTSNNMIAYCWAEIPGFSRFTSFIGNNSTNGPVINCGFSPAFVLVKKTNDATGGNWYCVDSSRDPVNPADNELLWDLATSEDYDQSAVHLDFLSNGFKMRSSGAGAANSASSNVIVLAFAENPFAATTPATAR